MTIKTYLFWPILLLIAIVILIGFNTVYQFLSTNNIPSPGVDFEISHGDTLSKIAASLEKQKVVSSAFYLKFFLRLNGQSNKIKVATYHFEGNLSLIDIAQILVHGGKELKITIPEGYNLEQIQQTFASSSIEIDLANFKLGDFTSKFSFLSSFPANVPLEGFLFPDSYNFFKDTTSTDVVAKFLENFQTKAMPEFLQSSSKSYYNDLILASILEKEVRTADDKVLVADILKRRLAKNMPLETDATLIYVLGVDNLAGYQLNFNSPYNTYKYKGLPPTPISNPGLVSIQAALNPKANNYWYYLTTKDGRVIYAKTLKEQLENKAKYLGR